MCAQLTHGRFKDLGYFERPADRLRDAVRQCRPLRLLAQRLFRKFSLSDISVRAPIPDQGALRIEYRQPVRLEIAQSFVLVLPSQHQTGPAALFADPLPEQFA